MIHFFIDYQGNNHVLLRKFRNVDWILFCGSFDIIRKGSLLNSLGFWQRPAEQHDIVVDNIMEWSFIPSMMDFFWSRMFCVRVCWNCPSSVGEEDQYDHVQQAMKNACSDFQLSKPKNWILESNRQLYGRPG